MEYSVCWLEYKKNHKDQSPKGNIAFYSNVEGPIIDRAFEELEMGFDQLYSRKVFRTISLNEFKDSEARIQLISEEGMKAGYVIKSLNGGCEISASTQAGLLQGVFKMLRNLTLQEGSFESWCCVEAKEPSFPIRMLDHWDNMDGSIERGYSGNSFFFCKDELLVNERILYYARLISSVGINAICINNVNVSNTATQLISPKYYDRLKQLTKIFGSYAIQLYLSINFASPMELGGLESADPMDTKVQIWWREKAQEIYQKIPEFGGFLVKADSEGRPGPFTYGRTHADGANMLARALKPFGGKVIWRCFVYNCQQDWRDKVTDRAKSGYDNFQPLDGKFDSNVILQIKNGPMDFQVREPVSPLFGGLSDTNMMLEVQIAQEYTGQQRHVCYLIPWFKQVMETDLHAKKERTTVADLVSGRTYGQENCGIVAVANTGDDFNWTGHDLAQANLYGFGRMAYDESLSAEDIAKEWITLTFGPESKVQDHILRILMESWRAYENYTAPLGIGWMVVPQTHYGPSVDGYEYDRWGTYHRADSKGIGVDRTKKGTNYVSQYHEPLASMYNGETTCPEELLLFFHHMPYDHILSSGKTILQHIYDTHFEGVEKVEQFVKLWKQLKDLVEPEVFERVQKRLLHQLEHSKEWRDVINSYFYRKTGIPDVHNRTIY